MEISIHIPGGGTSTLEDGVGTSALEDGAVGREEATGIGVDGISVVEVEQDEV